MKAAGRAVVGLAAVCLSAVVLAACGGGTGSKAGLTVKVTDLPHGVGGDVTVYLPNGSHRVVRSTTSFSAAGHYRLDAASVTVGTRQYAPTRATSAATVTSGKQTTVTVDYADIIPSTTKVLAASGLAGATLSAGAPSGPGTITFPPGAPLPSGLAVGDVLASGATPQTPDGLLVKVVSVTTGASGTTVTTTPASLPEALPRGRLQIETPIGPPENAVLPVGVSRGAAIPLTSATTGAVPSGTAQLASAILAGKPIININRSLPAFTLSPTITLDATQAEADSSPGSSSSGESQSTSCNPSGVTGSGSQTGTGGVGKQETAAGLDVAATVSLQPTFHLDASWGFGQPLLASFSVTMNEASKTDVEANMAYSCTVKANLPSTPFALDRIPFFAGFIPGEIKVGLQGQGSIKGVFTDGINIGADQSAKLTVGVTYDNGTFKPTSHFSDKLKFAANPVVTLSATAAMGPALTFELDDQGGPMVDLQGTVSAVVSSDQKKSGVFLGANAGVGFQLNIFGLPQMNFKTSVPLWKTKVWPPKSTSGKGTTTTTTSKSGKGTTTTTTSKSGKGTTTTTTPKGGTTPSTAPVSRTTTPSSTPTTAQPASCITSPCTAGSTGVEVSIAQVNVVTATSRPTTKSQYLAVTLHVDNSSSSDVTFGSFANGPTIKIVGSNHVSTRWTQVSDAPASPESDGRSCFGTQSSSGYTVLPAQNLTLPRDFCFPLRTTGTIVFPILQVIVATQPFTLNVSPAAPPPTTTTTTAPVPLTPTTGQLQTPPG